MAIGKFPKNLVKNEKVFFKRDINRLKELISTMREPEIGLAMIEPDEYWVFAFNRKGIVAYYVPFKTEKEAEQCYLYLDREV